MGTTKNAWKTQTIRSPGPTKSLNQPHHCNALLLVLECPHWLSFGSIGDTYQYLGPSGALVAILLLIHSTHLSSGEAKLLGFIPYLSASSPDLYSFAKKRILVLSHLILAYINTIEILEICRPPNQAHGNPAPLCQSNQIRNSETCLVPVYYRAGLRCID